jgi:hypothetical protein
MDFFPQFLKSMLLGRKPNNKKAKGAAVNQGNKRDCEQLITLAF